MKLGINTYSYRPEPLDSGIPQAYKTIQTLFG